MKESFIIGNYFRKCLSNSAEVKKELSLRKFNPKDVEFILEDVRTRLGAFEQKIDNRSSIEDLLIGLEQGLCPERSNLVERTFLFLLEEKLKVAKMGRIQIVKILQSSLLETLEEFVEELNKNMKDTIILEFYDRNLKLQGCR